MTVGWKLQLNPWFLRGSCMITCVSILPLFWLVKCVKISDERWRHVENIELDELGSGANDTLCYLSVYVCVFSVWRAVPLYCSTRPFIHNVTVQRAPKTAEIKYRLCRNCGVRQRNLIMFDQCDFQTYLHNFFFPAASPWLKWWMCWRMSLMLFVVWCIWTHQRSNLRSPSV